MVVYKAYNSYATDDFEENKKWSCHSWLFNCIENINECLIYIEKNSEYINQRDLVGKYNALNYLLDIYSYHQSSSFRNYPKDRNRELDFAIILYGLLENGGDINSVDYEGKSFEFNLQNSFLSQETLSWKQKNKFLNIASLELCDSKNKKEIIKDLLKNEKRPVYLGLNLEFNLSEKNTKSIRIKL